MYFTYSVCIYTDLSGEVKHLILLYRYSIPSVNPLLREDAFSHFQKFLQFQILIKYAQPSLLDC